MKIQTTKNYRLFHRHEGENREVDIGKHYRLRESMKRYGFLRSFPIVCYRDKDGNLYVKDGQHRLAIAEELGLSVWWVEETVNFDPAITSSAAKGWVHKDYAVKFASSGIAAYQELLDFSERFRVTVSLSATLLAGTTSFGNISGGFFSGKFKIKDREWGESVASLYTQLVNISHAVKDLHCLNACMAMCRVQEFDSVRLIRGAERCREKLVKYGSRDGYLDMFEFVYNFSRSKLFGLKLASIMAMRERNAVEKKKAEKVA